MLNHTFTWNGHSSDEFGIKIERFPGLNRPARKYTASNVPGRNGNLYELQDAWEEVIQSYEIYAGGQSKNSPQDFMRIVEWLSEPNGYAVLTDSYDVDHYREAVFIDAMDIANSWNKYGRAVVTFRCRPERFLNSGQNITADLNGSQLVGYTTDTLNLRDSAPSGDIIYLMPANTFLLILDSTTISETVWYQVELESGMTGWCDSTYITTMNAVIINNPTKRTAKPLITIMSTSALKLGINHLFLTTDGSSYGSFYVDCENENIYGWDDLKNYVNRNSQAHIQDYGGNVKAGFLKLRPGKNYLVPVYGISGITMNARFWEL